jgi:competence protein ComEC
MRLAPYFFLLVYLSATLISSEKIFSTRFIVWNIGQGQWTTLVSENACDHFDVGGEHDLSREVLKVCQGKSHRIHLSHWDWDHMGLIPRLRRGTSQLCLWNRPLGKSSARKEAVLEGIPHCRESVKPYQKIFAGDSRSKASTNESSQVVATHGILIPGDSPIKEEKIWARQSLRLQSIQGLVLGHHGSRTSTSEFLLHSLPRLRWAVATARKKRYGHPHPEVLLRLKESHIPVLKTEDWGSLVFEL